MSPLSVTVVLQSALIPAMNVPTNPNAPVRCSQHIHIQASPEQVWAVLTDINAWAAWQTDIHQARLVGILSPGTTFTWKAGGVSIRSTLHTVEPTWQLGWTGTAMGTQVVHNWQLVPADGGTEVVVDESMQGLLARVFRKAFNRDLTNGMQRWLQFLKTEAEH